MTINLDKVENFFTSELNLTIEESKVFLDIVKKGMLKIDSISNNLGLDIEDAYSRVKSLIDKGMIIEYRNAEYECLHPKFAIVNRYRLVCMEKNVAFRKNSQVDNIATMLERLYELARQ